VLRSRNRQNRIILTHQAPEPEPVIKAGERRLGSTAGAFTIKIPSPFNDKYQRLLDWAEIFRVDSCFDFLSCTVKSLLTIFCFLFLFYSSLFIKIIMCILLIFFTVRLSVGGGILR
jgi:hypothetical protein